MGKQNISISFFVILFGIVFSFSAQATDLYGCVATDGVWACYKTVEEAGQKGCTRPVNTVSPADKCGCTQADYAAGKCKNGKQATTQSTQSSQANSAARKVDCVKNPNDCIYNPLPTSDLTGTFLLIVKGFLGIVAAWAVMFIIVGGFKMVMSAGNEEAYGEAKKTITWAILGLVIATLSFSIMAIVQNLLRVTLK